MEDSHSAAEEGDQKVEDNCRWTEIMSFMRVKSFRVSYPVLWGKLGGKLGIISD